MTFIERYQQEETWWGKIMIMEIYHLVMCQKNDNWSQSDTAKDFGLSVGLVSENLRIADLMHKDDKIINLKNRKEALTKI